MALAFGMMSFTNKASDTLKSNLKKDFEPKIESILERCTRLCTYAVNTSTGERRLKGCTEWTCDGGTLDEVIIRA